MKRKKFSGKRKFAKASRNEDSGQGAREEQNTENGNGMNTESNKNYEKTVRENEKFEMYYRQQNILPDEEFDQFMQTLRTNLPTTFRITGTRKHAFEIRDILQNKYFASLTNQTITHEDGTVTEVQAPQPLSWYPDSLAWSLNCDRRSVRKLPLYEKLHKFLVAETEIGNITRQEAVSMLPPLLLDVQPDHLVLDMCAAPGSKTTQLIEAIHAKDTEGYMPKGLVIANDADEKRSYLLVHQAKRLASPCLVVTNNDASLLPNIFLNNAQDGKNERVQFDRILCDVPCSGDGTFRKNFLLWKNWSVMHAYGLHGIQTRILERGCQLLKEGGRIVYSTCSLNPIENEAVVAAVLAAHPDAMELVDISEELQTLLRKPGMESWKVMSKNGEVFEKYEDIPEHFRDKFAPTYFPPSTDLLTKMNLTRCIRIYPHLQDCGGFFVAVLRKKGPITRREIRQEADAAESETVEPKAEEKEISADGRLIVARSKAREEPFIFLSSQSKDVESIFNFYGISDNLPRDQLLVRSMIEKSKVLYLVSSAVRKLLMGPNPNLKVVNTGIRMFGRTDLDDDMLDSCPYRLHNDGMSVISPFLAKRLVKVELNDIFLLLNEEFPKLDTFSLAVKEALQNLKPGCAILHFDSSTDSSKYSVKLDCYLPIWRGRYAANAFVSKQEKASLKARLEMSLLN